MTPISIRPQQLWQAMACLNSTYTITMITPRDRSVCHRFTAVATHENGFIGEYSGSLIHGETAVIAKIGPKALDKLYKEGILERPKPKMYHLDFHTFNRILAYLDLRLALVECDGGRFEWYKQIENGLVDDELIAAGQVFSNGFYVTELHLPPADISALEVVGLLPKD